MLITHSASNDKWLIGAAKLNHSEFLFFFLEEKTRSLLDFLLTQTVAQPVCVTAVWCISSVCHKTFYNSHHCITDPLVSLCIHCKCVRVLVCVRMHMLHTSINCMIGCYQLGFGASEFEFFQGAGEAMSECLDLLRLQVKRWLDGKSKSVWSNICFLVDVCLCHNHRIIQQGWQRLLRRGFGEGSRGDLAGQVPTAPGRVRLGELAPALPTLCLALAVANSSSHQCNTLMFNTTCM